MIAEFGGYYCIWGEDDVAPTTSLMTLRQLRTFVKATRGEQGLKALPRHMESLARKGTDSLFKATTREALLACNRAGKNHTRIHTAAGMVRAYLPSAKATRPSKGLRTSAAAARPQ